MDFLILQNRILWCGCLNSAVPISWTTQKPHFPNFLNWDSLKLIKCVQKWTCHEILIQIDRSYFPVAVLEAEKSPDLSVQFADHCQEAVTVRSRPRDAAPFEVWRDNQGEWCYSNLAPKTWRHPDPLNGWEMCHMIDPWLPLQLLGKISCSALENEIKENRNKPKGRHLETSKAWEITKKQSFWTF